ncbi:MAG TPA: hypothetical protein VKG43_01590 [Acidimicrobiales bacterium]|nr:hypothetical protein [Acidimicrobiales bacterium]
MRRLLLTAVALAIPAAGTVAFAGTASATSPTPVTCTKVVGGVATATVTLKGCNSGLGKGTAALTAVTTGGVITWKGHVKGTTTVAATANGVGQGGCKTGSTEVDVTGTVTADTTGVVTVGSPVSARACISSTGAISLVKHTVLTL